MSTLVAHLNDEARTGTSTLSPASFEVSNRCSGSLAQSKPTRLSLVHSG